MPAARSRSPGVQSDADQSSLPDRHRGSTHVRRVPASLGRRDLACWSAGARAKLLAGITDRATRRFVEVNYGRWDRLAGNAPLVAGVGPKPDAAGLYPLDMTREEFDRAILPGSRSEYTVLTRNAEGVLQVVPYSRYYGAGLERAAVLLDRAAGRVKALRTDVYRASDMAWLEIKDNPLDLVIGPIETCEDKLFGYKAGMPGTDSDLNAYDVVNYAGDCNAGSTTIAINLLSDEQAQLAKGTRRLQLKNAMRAKVDAIMVPTAARSSTMRAANTVWTWRRCAGRWTNSRESCSSCRATATTQASRSSPRNSA
jgi:hypothetical protein